MTDFIKKLLIAILAVYKKDDELIGFYLCEFIQAIAKPVVFVYVCGLHVKEYLDRFAKLIEPKQPDWSISE